MPGVFRLWINSGVTGWEYAYATSSSIGALSQCERPAGSFLVDLRGEIRFAGIAGAGGATLAARIGLPGAGLPDAGEGGAGGTLVAMTTRLPAPGPPGAAESAAGITAAGTTGLPPVRPPGATEGDGPILVARRALGLRGA